MILELGIFDKTVCVEKALLKSPNTKRKHLAIVMRKKYARSKRGRTIALVER